MKKTYQDGIVEGYYQALKFFVKAYRDSMQQIEKEWKLLKKNHALERKPE